MGVSMWVCALKGSIGMAVSDARSPGYNDPGRKPDLDCSRSGGKG